MLYTAKKYSIEKCEQNLSNFKTAGSNYTSNSNIQAGKLNFNTLEVNSDEDDFESI